MSANLNTNNEGPPPLPAALDKRWQELCACHLPILQPNSIWRYSRKAARGDAQQGWKLLTVYARNDAEAVAVAEKLDVLTSGIAAPGVPFDLRLKPESCVHYRYGAFHHQEIENEGGMPTLAVESPEGKLVPDARNSIRSPEWVRDPFDKSQSAKNGQTIDSPLATTFRVFRALSQRGKGGVYLAVDLSSQPERLCIIKEGRRDGEPSWDGRDGYWRIRNEKEILHTLGTLGVGVPFVFGSFEVERKFLLGYGVH